jgi:arylsulfatase A-like enzyme
MGSPEHLAAVASADSRAAQVAAALDAEGDDVLLVLCSDHGHETVGEVIPLEAMLIDEGLKEARGSSDLVVASNGTSASIYLSDGAKQSMDKIVEFLRGQEWVGQVHAGAALAEVGLRSDTALAIALSARSSDRRNSFGIPGVSYAIADPLSNDTNLGCGQHGGLGNYEQKPFLFLRGGGFGAGKTVRAPSSPVDIAPTVLRHLGLACDDMDGTALATA